MDNNENYNDNFLTINDLDCMDGIEFEEFLAKLFISQNYKIELTKASGDQGADLIIEKFNEKKVVQAKRYSSSVSNKSVQEAVGAINYYKANSAIVVTNSYFTASAIELAKANNVELWDRESLIKLLEINPIIIEKNC